MEDNILFDAVERYLKGEMPASEKAYFEQLRKDNAEIDMLVVEHKLFLHQVDDFAERKNLKHLLHETHAKLVDRGDISESDLPQTSGKVIFMWKKYRRVISIAASIAGVTALIISALVAYLTPSLDQNQLQQLSKDVEKIKLTQHVTNQKLNQVSAEVRSKIPANAEITGGGSAFMIDAKGYLVTNAHVLKGSNAVVSDNEGKEYNAKIAYIDEKRDLAILKINDADFKSPKSLPYNFRKSATDLGEELFTLGYPKNNEIVYSRGYMSAQTGHESDTSSCQISLPANPGNSGGPVFNHNGEIVGVLSTREIRSQGVVYAVKTKEIIKLIDELKAADTSFQRLKISAANSLKGLDRTRQVKQVQNYIFQVKAYNTN